MMRCLCACASQILHKNNEYHKSCTMQFFERYYCNYLFLSFFVSTVKGLATRNNHLLPRQSSEFSLVALRESQQGDSVMSEGKPTQEWDVDRYQSQHNFVWQYGTSLIELVNAQSNEKILDVGCGSGELAIALSMSADRVEVVGMDSDANMVARCREQYPHLRFFQGDVRNFQVNETFDVLFSNAALHWVPPADIHRAVASMARALKPGGRFVVEFGGKGNCEMILKATQEVLQTDLNPWYFPSIPEFGSLLEREGIEVTCASLFDRPTPLQEGEKGLVNWLLMFGGAFLREMTPSQREEKLNRIGEKLRDELWDGKQWIADYRRIRIIGKRM